MTQYVRSSELGFKSVMTTDVLSLPHLLRGEGVPVLGGV